MKQTLTLSVHLERSEIAEVRYASQTCRLYAEYTRSGGDVSFTVTRRNLRKFLRTMNGIIQPDCISIAEVFDLNPYDVPAGFRR